MKLDEKRPFGYWHFSLKCPMRESPEEWTDSEYGFLDSANLQKEEPDDDGRKNEGRVVDY